MYVGSDDVVPVSLQGKEMKSKGSKKEKLKVTRIN